MASIPSTTTIPSTMIQGNSVNVAMCLARKVDLHLQVHHAGIVIIIITDIILVSTITITIVTPTIIAALMMIQENSIIIPICVGKNMNLCLLVHHEGTMRTITLTAVTTVGLLALLMDPVIIHHPVMFTSTVTAANTTIMIAGVRTLQIDTEALLLKIMVPSGITTLSTTMMLIRYTTFQSRVRMTSLQLLEPTSLISTHEVPIEGQRNPFLLADTHMKKQLFSLSRKFLQNLNHVRGISNLNHQ